MLSTQHETQKLVTHLFRHQAGKIVASLTRGFGAGHLDLAEDVVQDALVKALQLWPFKGIPENPAGWLTLVAKNRALDLLRRDSSLAHKVADLEQRLLASNTTTNDHEQNSIDDHLALILLCTHPTLSIEQQLALTLKTACGFSTAEIARAFLTSEPTISQRLVRAKRQLRAERIEIESPGSAQLVERLDDVLRVIYLLFNEGYGATRGDDLVRVDLCHEAIRLGNLLLQQKTLQLPVVHALLALMMLQAARLPARTKDDGRLALLSEQDRSLWDQSLISLGLRHHGWSAAGDRLTTYHLQAEIAAIHATALSDLETDWGRIASLYDELYELEPTPVVALNAAIAQACWRGPRAGLALLEKSAILPALGRYHLLPAVKAELWKQLGELTRAAESYRAALACPCTAPERRFLEKQLESVMQRGNRQ